MKIGILSDTHDLLRPEVIAHLRGCGCILHGGDISSPGILERLGEIAPVKAVRGNNDKDWAEELPVSLDFALGGLRIYMTHKRKDLPADLSAYDLVIFGHSHRFEETWLPADLSPYDLAVFGHSHQYGETWLEHPAGRRTLLLNPGSCGPRRFLQPITLAVMEITEDGWQVKRIEIPHAPREAAPKPGTGDIRRQIEIVVKETQKGQTVAAIAQRYSLDPALVEQIARLYVTHPGVTADGIMTKMGL